MTPRTLADRLGRLDVRGAMRMAVGQAADRLVHEVRARLSQPPGENAPYPALRTGELRASIGAHVEDVPGGVVARIGSTSDVAVYQEHGTTKMPPRPFLAPAIKELGPAINEEIAAAVVASFVIP
jgi:HK97 gp10 family phage protein